MLLACIAAGLAALAAGANCCVSTNNGLYNANFLGCPLDYAVLVTDTEKDCDKMVPAMLPKFKLSEEENKSVTRHLHAMLETNAVGVKGSSIFTIPEEGLQHMVARSAVDARKKTVAREFTQTCNKVAAIPKGEKGVAKIMVLCNGGKSHT